jgi:hypothetical protein
VRWWKSKEETNTNITNTKENHGYEEKRTKAGCVVH